MTSSIQSNQVVAQPPRPINAGTTRIWDLNTVDCTSTSGTHQPAQACGPSIPGAISFLVNADQNSAHPFPVDFRPCARLSEVDRVFLRSFEETPVIYSDEGRVLSFDTGTNRFWDLRTFIQELPIEISSYIMGYAIDSGDLSAGLVCREWNDLTNVSIQTAWNHLKRNSPEGIIDFQQRMVEIEQTPGAQSCRHLAYFKKLAADIKQTYAIKVGHLFSEAQCDRAQAEAQEAQILLDESLVSIWPKIQADLNLLAPPQTAREIRFWLNDPANSMELRTIKYPDLSSLGFKILPPEIGSLRALRWLSLKDNQLSSLPDAIGRLSALQWLFLNGNQLSSLPDAIGRLSALQWLSLNDNQLSSLPDTIGGLSLLQTLALQNNHLRSLPDAIGSLSSLRGLDLEDNHLSSLPDTFGGLSRLQVLGLNGNPFVSLPASVLESSLEVFTSNPTIRQFKLQKSLEKGEPGESKN